MYFFRYEYDLLQDMGESDHILIGYATSENACRAIQRLLKPETSSMRTMDGTDQTTWKAIAAQHAQNSIAEGYAVKLSVFAT